VERLFWSRDLSLQSAKTVEGLLALDGLMGCLPMEMAGMREWPICGIFEGGEVNSTDNGWLECPVLTFLAVGPTSAKGDASW
jgi:hypothetical protein